MSKEYAPVLVPAEHRKRVEKIVAELEAADRVREDVDRAPLRQ